MIEEVIPCDHPKCDLHIVRPGKTQCSHEGAFECGSYDSIQMDKTKILVTNKASFNEIKKLEDDIQKWKKIADDWRQVAIALATDAGDPYMATDCYEDIRDGLYDTVRERMYLSPSIQQRAFDGIHDYAILISTKAGEAQELRVAAEDVSDAENTYYWEGYEAALDFAIDSLPNYNN
jgi:hypothetical protein